MFIFSRGTYVCTCSLTNLFSEIGMFFYVWSSTFFLKIVGEIWLLCVYNSWYIIDCLWWLTRECMPLIVLIWLNWPFDWLSGRMQLCQIFYLSVNLRKKKCNTNCVVFLIHWPCKIVLVIVMLLFYWITVRTVHLIIQIRSGKAKFRNSNRINKAEI